MNNERIEELLLTLIKDMAEVKSKLNDYSVNSRTLAANTEVTCNLFTQGGNDYPLINNMRSELTITYSE